MAVRMSETLKTKRVIFCPFFAFKNNWLQGKKTGKSRYARKTGYAAIVMPAMRVATSQRTDSEACFG